MSHRTIETISIAPGKFCEGLHLIWLQWGAFFGFSKEALNAMMGNIGIFVMTSGGYTILFGRDHNHIPFLEGFYPRVVWVVLSANTRPSYVSVSIKACGPSHSSFVGQNL